MKYLAKSTIEYYFRYPLGILKIYMDIFAITLIKKLCLNYPELTDIIVVIIFTLEGLDND